MRDDFEILRQMIRETATVDVVVRSGKRTVTLTEEHICKPSSLEGESVSEFSKTIISSITIFGLPENVFVIKVDRFLSPDAIFHSSETGACKRADYAIIADTGQKKRIIFLEMKKTKKDKKDIIYQLKGAVCFLHYCQKIGSEFWGEKRFLTGYEHRFVSIGHTSTKMRPRITRQNGHHTPETMLQLDGLTRLEFNQLAGG